jgi:hypothetical protein
MALFTFRIVDKHETQSFDESGSLISLPFGEWLYFNLALETAEVVIVSFRSYILFDNNDNPKEVTKVYLSDGSYVFASNKFETFKKNYTEEYVPLFAIKGDDEEIEEIVKKDEEV